MLAGGVLVGQGRAGGHRGDTGGMRAPRGAVAAVPTRRARPSAALCLGGTVPPARPERPGAVPAHGGSRSPR